MVRCLTCAKNNPSLKETGLLGIQLKGTASFKHLEVAFTEVKPCQGYKYLLVMVCTFTGWVEAYPTKTEKAKEVARFLLRDIISRFGFPLSRASSRSASLILASLRASSPRCSASAMADCRLAH